MIFTALLLVAQAEVFPIGINVPAGEVIQIEEWEEGADHEILNFDNVVIEEGGELILPEPPEFSSVRIRKLVAEQGAKIRFAGQTSGKDAPNSVDGGSASKSVFFIDHLDGHVVIEAKGGDGGNGLDGRPGRQGLEGGKGRDARKIIFFYWGGGDQGLPGGRGEDGEDGFDGGRGGNGGEVQVFFRAKTHDSQILIDVSGGKGGTGGKPGRGGLGGNGGPGGKGVWRGAQGPMGISGNNGRPGRPGEPGFPGKATMIQVDDRLYKCMMRAQLVGENSGEMELCLSN